MSFDPHAIRADFPILSRRINGHPLIYLDSGASAQKPRAVIEAMTRAMTETYANVHRGLHTLANETTDAYEHARETVRRFLNAASMNEIVFTKGTTDAINLVASSFGADLKAGDEILLTEMEHHANIVPWHFLRERAGVVLKFAPVTDDGALDMDAFLSLIGERTKMVAVTHMSNVLGTINPVKAITAAAHAAGAAVLIDGAQGAVHMPVDVQDLDADFYTFSGHKLYGPSGSGAIYITPQRMAEMRPFLGGGDMIREVTRNTVTYNTAPMKFEAGTPGIVQQIGFGVALDYLTALGMEKIAAHERALRDYARSRLGALNWLNIQGNSAGKGAIFSFTMQGQAHAHDLSTILDKRGIAVRAGTHCAMPLMSHLAISASCRASFGLYNTVQEVDALVSALEFCHELFG